MVFIMSDVLNVNVAIEKQALLTEFLHWNMLRCRKSVGDWKMTLQFVLGDNGNLAIGTDSWEWVGIAGLERNLKAE
jgi:hypothetical protein